MKAHRNVKAACTLVELMASRRTVQAGYTLVELLTSMAILGVMLGVLFSVFDNVQKAWLQGENRVETFTQARAALDYMSRELAEAMVNTNSLQFFGTNTAVAFIVPSDDQLGGTVDLAEIVYRLSQPSAHAQITPQYFGDPFTNTVPPYSLMRRYTPYSETQVNCRNYGLGTPCAGIPWDFYSNLIPDNWMETAPKNRVSTLAENIVSLNFTFVSTNGTQYPFWNSTYQLGVWGNELPNNGIPRDSMTVNGLHGIGCAYFMTNHAPAHVIITLQAIDSRTAARLSAIAPGGVTNSANINSFTNTLNQAIQVFTTSVAIPNQ
jgi:prepilin-type N-terminal cleavage/methylation domain-containing protein